MDVRIQAGSAADRMTTQSPDPANDAAGGLETGLVLREPATPLATGSPPLHIPLARPSALVVSRVIRTAFGTVSGGWHHNPDESWYGPGFYGNRTACGETLTTTLIGVANRTLPCGTLVELRNPRNGETITVPVVDRGPYVSGREWDLTYATCTAISHCWTGPLDWRFP